MNSTMLLPIIGTLLMLPTLLPISTVSWWWVRIWDFPRLQLTVLYVVAIVLLYACAHRGWARFITVSALALCAVYQVTWIYAYLPMAPVQTQRANSSW